MNRTLRLAVFGIGAVGLAVAYVIAAGLLPHFGGDRHPYGDRSVREAIAHRTSNTVSSLAFDQRGFDTVGEEFILVLAVIGGTLLLRAQEDEDEGGDEDQAPRTPPVSDAVRLMGYLALPVTVVIGVY